MIAPVLQVWSGPRCDPSAYPLAAIPPLTQIRLVETIAGSDDAGTLTLPRTLALACGVSEGRVLRAWWPGRDVIEWVILRVADSDPGGTTSVTLASMRALLAWRGDVRRLDAVSVSTDLPAFSGTVADLLTARALTNLAEDRLTWLQVGTMGTAAVHSWPAQAAIRRGEVLTLIEQVTGYEVALRPLAGDAGYAIDVLERIGDDLETRLVSVPWQSIGRTRDLLQAATEVIPSGEDGQPMGEVDWLGGVASGLWIPLTDPDGGPPPIREDHQCEGTYLGLPDGSALTVLETRASDSAVRVEAIGSYSTGQHVCFWETPTGRPLSRLTAPAARTERDVSALVSVQGARAERTLNANPDFALGVTGWTPGTAGTVIAREDFGVTRTFAADGARSGGTGTGTPFTVDGLPPGAKIYRFDTIEHAGAQLAVSSAAIPSTSGVLALNFSPGLPANYADNDPITLRRQEVITATVSTATPKLSGILFVQCADADVVQRLAAFAVIDNPGVGDLKMTGAGGEIFDEQIRAIFQHEDDADVLVVRYAAYGAVPADPPTETPTCTNFAVVSAHRLRLYVSSNVVTGNAVVCDIAGFGATNIPAWLPTPSTGGILRFAGTIAGTGTQSGQPYIDVDIIGLPAACDLTGLVGYLPSGQIAVYDEDWSGSIDARWLRETRVLRFQGAHSIGATSATFKAIAPIARTDWAGGQQLKSASGSYGVSGSASWAANGKATVPCGVPSGVTIRAGERVWASWHGTNASDSRMVAVSTVVGPASSVEVRGGDAYRSTWDGVSTPITGLYQVPAGSLLEVVGNTLVVAADAVADGTGAASLTLEAANPNAIADNAVLTLSRPAMPVTSAHALRLLYAPGGNPPIPGIGVPSSSAYVHVPPGGTRTVTATMRVAVQPDTLGVGSAPLLAIVSAIGEQIRGTATITGTTTYEAVTVLELHVTTALTQSGLYKLRLTGGSNSNAARWHVVLDAQWYIGDEVLPVFAGARSRATWQRAQQVLAQRSAAARYTVRGLDLAALREAGALRLGQRLRIRSDALGIDVTQRVVRLTWQLPAMEVIDAECAMIAPRLTDTTVAI